MLTLDDALAYVATNPPPSRRELSETLWEAAGQLPVPQATIYKIQRMVAHFQQASVAADAALVAESSNATVAQVQAVLGGTAVSTSQEHPDTSTAWVVEQAAWEDRFARALIPQRLVTTYCVDVERLRAVARRLCAPRPHEAMDWADWARQVQVLGEMLDQAWSAGFAEGRDEL